VERIPSSRAVAASQFTLGLAGDLQSNIAVGECTALADAFCDGATMVTDSELSEVLAELSRR